MKKQKLPPTELTSYQIAEYSQGFCDMDNYVDIVKQDIEALKTETNMIGED